MSQHNTSSFAAVIACPEPVVEFAADQTTLDVLEVTSPKNFDCSNFLVWEN
jgi:hypothetical protein